MVTAQSYGSLGGGSSNKITKARGKVVKPILKKLSYSEKGSLDLDRGWEDQQQVPGIGSGYGLDADVWEMPGVGRSVKDVSFDLGAGLRGGRRSSSALGREGVTGPGGGVSGSHGSSQVIRKSYQQHGRSHSGNSVATNGSGGTTGGMRSGTFVHPFQQMPRTSTPPLSYDNSIASFDNSSGIGNIGGGGGTGPARDYSPTITENEDDDGLDSELRDASLQPHLHLHASSTSHSHHPSLQSTHSSTLSQPQSGLRRPSFASQRTSSLTDITSALTSSTTPHLRLSTASNGRSTPTSKTSRLAPSRSDLHLNLTLSDLEASSPSASTSISGATPVLASAATAPSASVASPTTPMSIRTSLEAMGRLRSRSEIDTAVRQEQIRQARRKFEERERAKEAKYEREEVERRNRRANKEASRIEKETREWYKAAGVSSGGGGSGNASASSVILPGGETGLAKPSAARLAKGSGGSHSSLSGRPSASRKTTPTGLAASASAPTLPPPGRSVRAGVLSHGNGHSHRGQGSFGMAEVTPAGESDTYVATSGYYDYTSIRKDSGLGKDRQANLDLAEKGLSGGLNYDSMPQDSSQTPRFGASIEDGDNTTRHVRARRGSNAKKKTQTAWQGFVLWLRTRIFKLKRKAER